MLRQGSKPNHYTYPLLFKTCSALAAIGTGEQLHAHVFKLGFHADLYIGNSLIDMYAKSFRAIDARRLFDEMLERDEVSYNSMVSGYVHCGDIRNASDLFEQVPMRRNVVCWTAMINGYGKEGMIGSMFGLFLRLLVSADDVTPNAATMVCLLSACSKVSNYELGRWVSVFVDVNAIPLNVMLSTALIDMHSKCGDVNEARRVFDLVSDKTSSASWNSMITGYVRAEFPEEAIRLFGMMGAVHSKPNEITLVNVLSACARLGALELGREVHLYLGRSEMDMNMKLATAVVDMYSKCGSIDDACLVFVKAREKDVALWNAMIFGLAMHGRGRDALSLFDWMEREGIHRPDEVTFVGVLSACCHSGLVEQGRYNFKKLVSQYQLRPKIEHYSCMVDLLGRAGCLDEAFELVNNMTVPLDSIIWVSLLGACRTHCNIKLADEVRRVVLINSSESLNLGLFLLLGSVYASMGWWTDVEGIRRLMEDRGMRKTSGRSWVEVDESKDRLLLLE
ncbi:Pentatricopeptide repeat-containing protein [Acorus calamus]|uniref:Pentatricopeptide repeat-containing protein n=1 Tax=Acorus calamus TaxID=4465 RepID=A0AAV9DUF1_ACOCL|nr:Pentatricopeptide repeat-containing protein [Acorus calamus]